MHTTSGIMTTTIERDVTHPPCMIFVKCWTTMLFTLFQPISPEDNQSGTKISCGLDGEVSSVSLDCFSCTDWDIFILHSLEIHRYL